MEMDLEHAMLQKIQRMKMNAQSNAQSNGMDMVANAQANANAVAVWRWALRGIVIQNQ